MKVKPGVIFHPMTNVQLTWSSCTQSDQPATTGKEFHMGVIFPFSSPHLSSCYSIEVNTDKDEVTINTAGTYKIEFTTLMQSTDKKLFRTEIFKVFRD